MGSFCIVCRQPTSELCSEPCGPACSLAAPRLWMRCSKGRSPTAQQTSPRGFHCQGLSACSDGGRGQQGELMSSTLSPCFTVSPQCKAMEPCPHFHTELQLGRVHCGEALSAVLSGDDLRDVHLRLAEERHRLGRSLHVTPASEPPSPNCLTLSCALGAVGSRPRCPRVSWPCSSMQVLGHPSLLHSISPPLPFPVASGGPLGFPGCSL